MPNEFTKPLIGVITARAAQSEQRQILKGIINQAISVGADTAVFSNIYNSSEYSYNIDVENKIYDLISSEKLDGLILTSESFMNPLLKESLRKKLSERTNIPIVVTGTESSDYPSVNNDIRSDIRNIVNHLIEIHSFNNIDFLTGGFNIKTSHDRIDGYKDALEMHGINFNENNIIFGDFWTTSGEALAKEYINGKRKLPEAIVCANDYMAYGLCDTLYTNGITVPDDVTVIGYEYIGERFCHAPILTTYQRNRYAIGIAAVNMLWKKLKGIKLKNVPFDGHLVYGNSCTCGTDSKQFCNELDEMRQQQFYSNLNFVGNFEQELTLCRSITDYITVLQRFTYLIRNISGLHLCLYENWCSSEISPTTINLNTETMICYRILTKKNTSDEPCFYNKYDLFPESVKRGESGSVMYFCPVFFSGRELGYFILQYENPDVYDIFFCDWLKIAANALSFLRMKNDINTLLECINLSYFHDSVTGLYNENGLRNELIHSLKKTSENDKVLLILIRSELFCDDTSLDHQKIFVRISTELSENLKHIAIRENELCAKLSDKLYAFVSVGEFPEKYENILADKLKTLIQHSPLYSENCELDSIVCSTLCESTHTFNFDNAIHNLNEQINHTINILSERRKHANYRDFSKLRKKIYLNPQKKWDSQLICRDFHLSYGHFRATYREIFGISFHQDVIQSRISLAKYLLLTSALNIPNIAYNCGYEDNKYFLRQFRQQTGITPNMYKSINL